MAGRKGNEPVNPFSYTRVADVATAVREIAADETGKFIAGGTNLIDLMKENVARPGRLIDITRVALREIRPGADGGLCLGALATNTEVAITSRSAAGTRFIWRSWLRRSSATWQRRAGTVAANALLLLRHATPCNSATGDLLSGNQRLHRMYAILGRGKYRCHRRYASAGVLEAVVRVTALPASERFICGVPPAWRHADRGYNLPRRDHHVGRLPVDSPHHAYSRSTEHPMHSLRAGRRG